MTKRLRILIADANRFYSLLMARELHERFTSCVTATFRSTEDALCELKRSRYDAAIVEFSIAYVNGRNLFAELKGRQKRLPLILTATPGTVLPDSKLGSDGVITVLFKKEAFQSEIPDLIQSVLENGSFREEDGQPAKLLNVETRAETVNIAARTLAHEINNPLMSILGMTELLLGDRGHYSPDIRSKIEVIEESARRIESVMGQLEEVSEPILKSSAVGDLIDTRRF